MSKLILIVLASVGLVAPAWGQTSPAELRRHAESLQAELDHAKAALARAQDEVARLEQERDSLKARLEHAEAENERLLRQVGAIREPTLPPGRAPTPTDPFASPLSLLLELQKRYDQQLAILPTETPEQEAAFETAAKEWCAAMPKELRGEGEWVVRFDEPRRLDAAWHEARVTVYDERTMLPIGEPFVARIPTRQLKRVLAQPEIEHWRASVFVHAEPSFNAERESPGVFNVPYFVGRMVEFGIGVEWRRLLPIVPAPVGDPNAAEAPELENEER